MKRGMKKSERGMKKRGQIWVETIIYTLIAFAMIGLVLAFVKPRIDEIQDRGITEQSIKLLEDIDDVIKNMGDPGNQRVIEVGIRKGSLKIDGVGESLIFELESESEFSEAGEDYLEGDVLVQTEKIGNLNEVTLTILYPGHDLTYDDKNEIKILGKSSTPYKLLISNKGEDAESKIIINFKLLS
jgi:hypothetical protein